MHFPGMRVGEPFTATHFATWKLGETGVSLEALHAGGIIARRPESRQQAATPSAKPVAKSPTVQAAAASKQSKSSGGGAAKAAKGDGVGAGAMSRVMQMLSKEPEPFAKDAFTGAKDAFGSKLASARDPFGAASPPATAAPPAPCTLLTPVDRASPATQPPATAAGAADIPYLNTMDAVRGALSDSAADGSTLFIDFTANWCGPCQRIAHVFAALAAEAVSARAAGGGRAAAFAKVDVDENVEAIEGFRVQAMPTFKAFCNGSEVGSFTGADEHGLREFVRRHASTDHALGGVSKEQQRVLGTHAPTIL